jgi:hypothetical protein
MTRAALRLVDQRRGRVPDRCVKRGLRTDGAVHAWAVGLRHADVLWLVLGPALRLVGAVARRPREQIVLPVSPPAWSSLRAGLRWAVVVAGLGAGALALGAVQGDVALVALGAVLLVAAWLVRAFVLWRRWVGLVLRPGGEDVALTRVSPEFGEAARALFVGPVAPPRR